RHTRFSRDWSSDVCSSDLMENKDVKMLMNDLSDEVSKAKSKEMLDKAGIYKLAEKNTGTGMLYFLDAQSKNLLSKVSLARTNNRSEERRVGKEDRTRWTRY